jgi:Trk-type K+ transport system membrane component
MIPFSTSFVVIYVLNVVMLAGNHALPMMLRFYIWLGTKIWRRGQTNETLHFLLDHPRRYVLLLHPVDQIR